MKTPFKFTEDSDEIYNCCYDEEKKHYVVWQNNARSILLFHPWEVEDYINRGVWEKIS